MASTSTGLKVIALVSGGKDSFFSALHCLENGHHLVALANLHPPLPPPPPPPPPTGSSSDAAVEKLASVGNEATASGGTVDVDAGLARLALGRPSSTADVEGGSTARPGCGEGASDDAEVDEEETDLNSFMYQTVGHQVIPLYAEATGLPLYRRPIVGGAVQSGRDYCVATTRDISDDAGEAEADDDETESMIPLLRSIIKQHPEANALSAGAILSTYQRTRVESVALRLGLTPLAYLWKYPVHPAPALASAKDDAQLLFDMAAAGLEARIIKVASGGLDESFLWENVASAKGVMRLKKAMGRFGCAGTDTGAVLGEGGEFETLVVDGPGRLFKKRVVVTEEDRVVIREGGGTAWIKVTRAEVEDKMVGEEEILNIRRPDLLDERFAMVLDVLKSGIDSAEEDAIPPHSRSESHFTSHSMSKVQTWAVVRPKTTSTLTIQEETTLLVDQICALLTKHNLAATSILSTIIVLRSMADFPAINAIYGSLFTEPNPPSRVTISCGDLLPSPAGNIAIYLTLHTGKTDRQGLHVQGRSYWAPANIGPYSQAITFPVTDAGDGVRAVHIAGQIPLVPASMELPTDGMETQLVLSLQHLWRIGAEMGVQWWTSGAVYFPRSNRSATASLTVREKAHLAWGAWKEAHRWSSRTADENEDENGPDLWDRKFNPLYMSYTADSNETKKPGLPDYSLLGLGEELIEEEKEQRKPVPFFFAVEVEELPRSAEAEWHAHAGLSGMDSERDSIRVYRERHSATLGMYDVEHCLLTADAGGMVHSLVAVEAGAGTSLEEQIRETNKVHSESLAKLMGAETLSSTPYLLYVHSELFAADQITQSICKGLAVIPCASICGGPEGAEFGLVALYRMLLS